MKVFWILSAVLFSAVLAVPRVKREACEEAQTNYDACVASAHAEHRLALAGGDDGRPDFYSRKSCNFIEAAVMTCGDLLIGDCFPEDSIQAMRNQQFESIVASLEQSDEWDSDKCESVKQWKDQMAEDDENADEDAEDAADDEEADADEDGDGTPDEEEGEGGEEEEGEDGEEDGEDEEGGDGEEDGDGEAEEGEDGDEEDGGDGEEEDGGDGDGEEDGNGEGEDDGNGEDDGGEGADSSAPAVLNSLPAVFVAILYMIC